MLPIPEGVEFEISKITYNLLCGKRDKIKQSIIIAPQEEGGISMVDIRTKFMSDKASWVDRIINSSEVNQCFWLFFLKYI